MRLEVVGEIVLANTRFQDTEQRQATTNRSSRSKEHRVEEHPTEG